MIQIRCSFYSGQDTVETLESKQCDWGLCFFFQMSRGIVGVPEEENEKKFLLHKLF